MVIKLAVSDQNPRTWFIVAFVCSNHLHVVQFHVQCRQLRHMCYQHVHDFPNSVSACDGPNVNRAISVINQMSAERFVFPLDFF